MSKIPYNIIGSYFRSISIGKTELLQTIEKTTNKHKFEILYLYRAFLCKQVLLRDDNWAQITMRMPHFISEFFNFFSQTLLQPFPRAHTFMVIELIELFLKRDPEQVFLNLVQYNIPFTFLWNIEKPNVRNFIINLISFPQNPYKLDEKYLLIFSQYFKYTNFFIDYLNIMLDGGYQIDQNKIKPFYQVEELNNIYDDNKKILSKLEAQAFRALKLQHTCSINWKTAPITKNLSDDFQLIEEKQNIILDIDRIYPMAQPQTSFETSKFSTQKKQEAQPLIATDFNSKLSMRASRMYPSKLEELRKEEEIKNKEKQLLAATIATVTKVSKKSRTSINRSRSSLTRQNSIRELSMESLSTSRDVSRIGERSIRNDSKYRLKTGNSDDGSIYPTIFGELEKKDAYGNENRIKKKSKKNKDSTTLQFNHFMLKMVHPQVKQHIYISHFQNIKAPLTQSVLGIHALPSKSGIRSLSLPSLSRVYKEILLPDELESLAKERPYSPTIRNNNEEIAYPMSIALQDLIFIYLDNLQPSSLMVRLGRRSTEKLLILESLQGKQGPAFLNLLFRVIISLLEISRFDRTIY